MYGTKIKSLKTPFRQQSGRDKLKRTLVLSNQIQHQKRWLLPLELELEKQALELEQ